MDMKRTRPQAQGNRPVPRIPPLDEATIIDNMDRLYRAYRAKGEQGVRELLQRWKAEKKQSHP